VVLSLGRGIALLFHTAALEGVEWSGLSPCRTLPPEKNWYTFYRMLGGPKGRSGGGGVVENLVQNGIRSRIEHPVVSR